MTWFMFLCGSLLLVHMVLKKKYENIQRLIYDIEDNILEIKNKFNLIDFFLNDKNTFFN